MTKETFEEAKNITDDLETIENIQFAHSRPHWVGFRTADCDRTLFMHTDQFRDDFDEFIEKEREKLQEMLEKL